MKRYFLLVVCLLLLLGSLTACNKQTSTDETSQEEPTVSNQQGASEEGSPAWAYDKYKKALKAASKYSGTNIYLTGNIIEQNDEKETETSLKLDFRSQEFTSGSEDELEIATSSYTDHLKAELMKDGEQTIYEVYYTDGIRYYSDKDGKYCQTIDRQSALPELAYFLLPDLTEAAFNNPIVAYEGDDTEISLPVGGDMLSDQLTTSDGTISYLTGGIRDDLHYTINDTTIKLTFNKKGYLTGYDLYYTVSIDDIKNTKLSISLVMVLRTPWKDIQVSLPNLSGYKEMYTSVLNKKAYEAMPTIVDALFDNDGKRLPNYKEQYKKMCDKYGKTVVNSVVAWFEKQL
ncbi:MAG: hypothetical protein J6Z00_02685 [Clostridia bacterium]|nr:hypothetical protein [Clostridia bacterium]